MRLVQAVNLMDDGSKTYEASNKTHSCDISNQVVEPPVCSLDHFLLQLISSSADVILVLRDICLAVEQQKICQDFFSADNFFVRSKLHQIFKEATKSTLSPPIKLPTPSVLLPTIHTLHNGWWCNEISTFGAQVLTPTGPASKSSHVSLHT